MSVLEPSHHQLERWGYTAICAKEFLEKWLCGEKAVMQEGIYLSVQDLFKRALNEEPSSALFLRLWKFMRLEQAPREEVVELLKKHHSVLEAVYQNNPRETISREHALAASVFFENLWSQAEEDRYADFCGGSFGSEPDDE